MKLSRLICSVKTCTTTTTSNSGNEFTSEEEIEWQCHHCGYVHKGKSAPKHCPVCGHPQGFFERKADNF